MQDNTYTFKFMAAVCFGCAILVSSAATGLKSLQEKNQKVDIQKNILRVTKIVEPDAVVSDAEVAKLYEESVKCNLVDAQGNVVEEGADPTTINVDEQEKAIRDISTLRSQAQKLEEAGKSAEAEKLKAEADKKESEMVFPIFVFPKQPPYDGYCIPIIGKGLWSTLYGYFALESDANTVRGITFYKHGETPGLGGEIENRDWQMQFPGKTILEDGNLVSIQVAKGDAPDDDPHAVDGISGATITSRGVETLLIKDLDRYKPFFSKIWEQKGN